MVRRSFQEDIELTPSELAKEFCDMDASQQAIFFNSIWDIVHSNWDCNFAFQMQFISDSKKLNDQGREILRTIGEYAE